MAFILADNITSPLGMTTEENYLAVKAGQSALRRYDGQWGLPEPFCASLFTDEQNRAMMLPGLTRFESLVVGSVRRALQQTDIDVASPRTIFILSTTKANIELLLDNKTECVHDELSPADAAQHIASVFGFTTEPVVVCNACISGVAALILAQRILDNGCYDHAVVCGADVQNRFTVSGFQSLKAVSDSDCRPFDMERTGLNLGEAAATVIMARHPSLPSRGTDSCPQSMRCWCIESGTIRNDAFHISSPSKNADGACLALNAIGAQGSASDMAFVNAHGTATMFNDQMESVAIERAGLAGVPVNGLKGYYGHTLGAAGVLETVLSIAAAAEGIVLATRGFAERGVSGKIRVTTSNEGTEKTSFVKMISGFGGGNAAVVVRGMGPMGLIRPMRPMGLMSPMRPISPMSPISPIRPMSPAHRVSITPTAITIDGESRTVPASLTAIYKEYVGDYPKFYKMDPLSQLGFLAAELLLEAENREPSSGGHFGRFAEREDRAVVLFNRSSSVAADMKYMETIADADNFFPSPSVFVYTLPNIVTGEIAMRNHYHGETSFYVLPRRDEHVMDMIIKATLTDKTTKSVIAGWVDYSGDGDYEADIAIVCKI